MPTVRPRVSCIVPWEEPVSVEGLGGRGGPTSDALLPHRPDVATASLDIFPIVSAFFISMEPAGMCFLILNFMFHL